MRKNSLSWSFFAANFVNASSKFCQSFQSDIFNRQRIIDHLTRPTITNRNDCTLLAVKKPDQNIGALSWSRGRHHAERNLNKRKQTFKVPKLSSCQKKKNNGRRLVGRGWLFVVAHYRVKITKNGRKSKCALIFFVFLYFMKQVLIF